MPRDIIGASKRTTNSSVSSRCTSIRTLRRTSAANAGTWPARSAPRQRERVLQQYELHEHGRHDEKRRRVMQEREPQALGFPLDSPAPSPSRRREVRGVGSTRVLRPDGAVRVPEQYLHVGS